MEASDSSASTPSPTSSWCTSAGGAGQEGVWTVTGVRVFVGGQDQEDAAGRKHGSVAQRWIAGCACVLLRGNGQSAKDIRHQG
jgi:hypothetical protein